MNRYYLWTIGCQMNDADAASIAHGLSTLGFAPTAEPREACLVVLITCVVRQSAEDKVVGRLSSLKHLKRTRPQAGIAVMGCFVGDAAALGHEYPYVDIFLKPSDIAGLLQFARERTQREPALPEAPAPVTPSVVASVPISYGCDHHCTYCIVRLRRGRHVSRPLPEVVEEARGWMARGAREVTLLGQNVDAYGQDLGPGAPDLADLLTAVHSIDGLWRIRFLTSHPAEMSDKLIRSVASLPRICPHFELPVQAGDDEVLQRMGRHYTVVRYRGLVDRIRALVPGCSIATDVIVGFPAESAAQFQATYDLVAGLHFDAVHIAKYSPRPSTPAARLADDVPPEEKERRRVALEELQTHIATEIHAAYLGQTVEVLVEERQRGRWKGRTINNRLVFFEDGSDWRGRLAHVHVEQTGAWSMRGSLVDWCPPGRDAETSGRQSTLPLV